MGPPSGVVVCSCSRGLCVRVPRAWRWRGRGLRPGSPDTVALSRPPCGCVVWQDGAWRLLEVPPSPPLGDGDSVDRRQSRVVLSSMYRSWGSPTAATALPGPRVGRVLQELSFGGRLASLHVTSSRSVPAVTGFRVSFELIMAVTVPLCGRTPYPSVEGRLASAFRWPGHPLPLAPAVSSRSRLTPHCRPLGLWWTGAVLMPPAFQHPRPENVLCSRSGAVPLCLHDLDVLS